MAAADGPPIVGTHRGASLPPRPGTYALILHLDRGRALTVGRLGRFRLPTGIYVYVGSARGPGGLAARVGRHLRRSGTGAGPAAPPHWHIDYLGPVARPVAVWLAEGDRRRECAWAARLAQMDGASLPVPGFGASDCRCPAHLVHFATRPSLAPLRQPPPRLEWSDRL